MARSLDYACSFEDVSRRRPEDNHVVQDGRRVSDPIEPDQLSPAAPAQPPAERLEPGGGDA
jgi:hypothetical protein